MAILALLGALLATTLANPSNPLYPDKSSKFNAAITIDWTNVLLTSKTTTTLQIVSNPPLLRGTNVHDNVYTSLESVAANYVRFVPWFPYPKLAVPEIDAPIVSGDGCSTTWDFTYADQLVEDFYAATPNASHIINFSTTPGWMWNMPDGATYTYPQDINDEDWAYGNKGSSLRDPTFKELADYYARLVSWYVKGGFTDECGVEHTSGHNYTIEYWEVGNEVEAEHVPTPEFYVQLYDAIVPAIQAVSPDTKFVGVGLGHNTDPAYFNWLQTFLDPAKHAPGIPLHFVSYHWYGIPDVATTDVQAAQCFAQADTFVGIVEQVEVFRKQLSPDVRTTLNEVGTFDPQATTQKPNDYEVPAEYFVWSGGVYAYVFMGVVRQGIDVIGESQLYGFPGQFPSVSMLDWRTGLPNARFKVLELLQKSFGLGDKVVETKSSLESVAAQAFENAKGVRKLLLVNKLNQTTGVSVPGFEKAAAVIVDLSTGGNEWRTEEVGGGSFMITPWATVVLTAVG